MLRTCRSALSHRLGFLARTGTATLARPLERLIFNLVLSLFSETSTRFRRRHSSVGSLTGEALQLLSYFKPGTVPQCMVESSAPSSPALDLAAGLIS